MLFWTLMIPVYDPVTHVTWLEQIMTEDEGVTKQSLVRGNIGHFTGGKEGGSLTLWKSFLEKYIYRNLLVRYKF